MNAAQQNLSIQKKIAALSIVLFSVKIFAWAITDSVAILTDALESIVNVVAGLLGVYSLHLSSKPKDTDHPYGHGKVEFISSAVEGTLICVAGVLIVVHAISNLSGPHNIRKLDLGIVLVAVTAIINYLAGYYCEKTGKKNNSLPLIAGGKHLKTDTYTTAGIVIGLALLYFFKVAWIDSAVAALFALIITFTGYKIIRSSVAGIMDEADQTLLNEMVQTLNDNRRANWMDVHNLRIIKYGAMLHLDAHLTVPWYLNVHEAHREIDELSGLLRKKYDDSLEIFVHSDGCLSFSCPICIKDDCPVRQHPFEKRSNGPSKIFPPMKNTTKIPDENLGAEYWSKRYKNDEAGWDMGRISPPLKAYIDQLTDKSIPILIPGCGNAYEAEYLLQEGFINITLIDISPLLTESLRVKFKSHNAIKIICGDFFELNEKYDLILEQTFFCALDLALREKYVQKMYELLNEKGKLAGVMFNRKFDVSPPFGGSTEEYHKLFSQQFIIVTMERCYNSVEPRNGHEVFVIFERRYSK